SDEIGDIDERIDRSQPDGSEAALQPIRRRCVFDAAHEPQPEGRTERRRRAEIKRHLHRTWKLAFDRFDRPILELPMPAAARSRAMPCTPVASPRLGVRLISIIGSSSPAYLA